MATVVLQVVGAAIGGAIGGPVGAAVGRAVGAAAGYAIDQQVFSRDQVIKGGRVDQTRFLTAIEGAPVPRVYGRVKTGGQIVWATRFEERRKRRKQGGKGGGSRTTIETYSYFANFAVGICEGPVSHIGRIWADGTELDRRNITVRLYKGTEDQEPDPLIAALQGLDRTPAFRGTAYAVFEDLPLTDYGNRIPQITFEVIRAIAEVDRDIRAITLIPGAGEFVYAPEEKKTGKKGRAVSENRHVHIAESDWEASLDELQALCPNLKRVALVVSWFGNDLRAGSCTIEPRVAHQDISRTPWSVCGIERANANLVSQVEGRPAYGGTPSDQSVMEAISDLKSRGLEVTLYPFLMMDIPPDNSLPDPHGATSQPAYPWRGRLTCYPAIGQPSTADQTAIAANQIASLVGASTPEDYSVSADAPVYQGPVEFTWRRMILHYANLCRAAGGVERFFIGSEMRALTQVRDQNGAFPFVDALVELASDVNAMMGGQTQISYAADWTEYFGYHPQDGSGDVLFHLDPLWASPDIAAVSIDNYMPVSDWKENGDPAQPEAPSRHALSYLRSNIAKGEGKDWYYASMSDRILGIRTPITDGFDEPWIWSFKALKEWWGSRHYNRSGGVRSATPTVWQPGSKPVWFSEIGCPATDRGANQPNVFVDAKSAESALPYHSRGGRDDLMQLRYTQAVIGFWRDADATENPVSNVYEGRMVEAADIYPWAWDARPFPAFPQHTRTWSDGENWYRGHWLNGRIGTCPLDDLIRQILQDQGFEVPHIEADGHVDGYLVSGDMSPKQVLEPLVAAWNLAVGQHDRRLVFRGKDYGSRVVIDPGDLVQEDEQPSLIKTNAGEHELARQISVSHGEIDNQYDGTTSFSRRLETASKRQHSVELPAVMSRQSAVSLMNARLQDHWIGRETVMLGLGHRFLGVEPGDVLTLDCGRIYRVVSINDGADRRVEAMRIKRSDDAMPWIKPLAFSVNDAPTGSAPLVIAMNLPLQREEFDPAPRLYFAAFAEPWTRPLTIVSATGENGFEPAGSIGEPAQIFELLEPLNPGPEARWDNASILRVRLLGSADEFASTERLQVFSGANALAIGCVNGEHEIIQFRHAELTGSGEWVLSGLLRAQMGTAPAMESGSAAGAYGVVLDAAVVPITLPAALANIERNWRVGPANQDYASNDYSALAATCSHISKRPLRPVHPVLLRESAGYKISWIRQTRVNGDSWEGVDVPLDFLEERYRVSVFDSEGVAVRVWETTIPHASYADGHRIADLGNLASPFEVAVAQLDERRTAGPATRITVMPQGS